MIKPGPTSMAATEFLKQLANFPPETSLGPVTGINDAENIVFVNKDIQIWLRCCHGNHSTTLVAKHENACK